MFRDPRYLAPLGVLLGVIVVAAAAAHNGPGRSSAYAAPPTTAAASDAVPIATPLADGAVDAHRMGDLVEVRDAMLMYRQEHGRFPVSKQLAPLCGTSSDPGCALAPAPFADGNEPYRFRSDGERVYLVARGDAANDVAQCPPTLPDELTGVPLLCLVFERPVR